jgi:hypothetical protein
MKFTAPKPKERAKSQQPKRQTRLLTAQKSQTSARRPAAALAQRIQSIAPEKKQPRPPEEPRKPREELPANIAEKLAAQEAYRKDERAYQGKRRDYHGREQDMQEEKKKFYQPAEYAHQSTPPPAYVSSDISNHAENRPYKSETSAHRLFINASATLNDVVHKPAVKKHEAHQHEHAHHSLEPPTQQEYHKHEHHGHEHHHNHSHHNHAHKKDAADLLKMKQESYCPSHGYSCGSYHDNKRDSPAHMQSDPFGSQKDKPYCPSHGYTCGTTHAAPVTLRFAKK